MAEHAEKEEDAPSFSQLLKQFNKEDNVALIPDKSLLKATSSTKYSPSSPTAADDNSADKMGTQTLDNRAVAQPDAQPSNGTKPVTEKTTAKSSDKTEMETPDNKEASPSNNLLANADVLDSQFAQERATEYFRVCCYGSSSSLTPQAYMKVASEVGYLLGKRGHTCVNGAGPFGCMAALNEGAEAANGHIVGVIHKWLFVDGSKESPVNKGLPEDPCYGANPVFDNVQTIVTVYDGDGAEPYKLNPNQQQSQEGPLRELVVCGGADLQERKRLLVRDADALIVLPGGPGTFDELWEMACARNLGLSKLPIICINIDGYYEPFRDMLNRAWKDKLTKLKPSEIIFFASSAKEAVEWCENVRNLAPPKVEIKKRKNVLRNQSVLGSPIVEDTPNQFSLVSTLSWVSNAWNEGNDNRVYAWTSSALTLMAGIGFGYLLSESRHNLYSSLQY